MEKGREEIRKGMEKVKERLKGKKGKGGKRKKRKI